MKKLQLALAALAAAGTLSLATPVPAYADSAASTRNIILGVAAIAGIAIESNVARKNAQANTVTGYLQDGSRVYGDGHVVTGNGYSYYPGNAGQRLSCNGGRCAIAYMNGNAPNHDTAYRGGGNYGGANFGANHGNVNRANAHDGDTDNRGYGGDTRDHQPDPRRTKQ